MQSLLELSEEQRDLLAQTLESALAQLDVEIHRTDKLEFKEALQHRSDVLRTLLAKIGEPLRSSV